MRPADARSQDAAQVLEGLMVPTCAPAIMDFAPIIGKAVDAIGTLAFGFASYGWAIGGRVVGVHVVRSYFQGSCGLVFFVFFIPRHHTRVIISLLEAATIYSRLTVDPFVF